MIRHGIAALWLLLAAAFAGTGPGLAEPVVSEKVEYYDVTGNTPQEIRQDLNRIGPMGDAGRTRYDATTHWYVRWRYNYARTAQGCSISSVSLTVEVAIKMPRLAPSPNRLATVTSAFEDFSKNLMTHEKGHAQNGIDIARRIEEGIRQLPPESSCERLGEIANALGNSLIKEANRLDIEYDARTQHGRTQGARFP